jgi:hypothetical protein
MQVEGVLDQFDSCPAIINIGSAGGAYKEAARMSLADLPRAVHCMISVMMISVDAATQISS